MKENIKLEEMPIATLLRAAEQLAKILKNKIAEIAAAIAPVEQPVQKPNTPTIVKTPDGNEIHGGDGFVKPTAQHQIQSIQYHGDARGGHSADTLKALVDGD